MAHPSGCVVFDVRPMPPVSVIIPTRNRPALIGQTLQALLAQTEPPSEVIIVDASDAADAALTRSAVESSTIAATDIAISYHPAQTAGAAPQRNQGVKLACHNEILFLDDDIRMEPACLAKLSAGLHGDDLVGGVSALLHGNEYRRPGFLSRLFFAFLNGRVEKEYAGRCIGPGFTTLPAGDDHLPENVPVDWLITGCTLYRRAAMPDPPFLPIFVGPSIAEDLALSLTVGKKWRLLNARNARAAHISAPHHHTAKVATAISEMEFVNRHYIATQILGRRSTADLTRFFVMMFLFLPTSLLQPDGARLFLARLLGRLRGLSHIYGGT